MLESLRQGAGTIHQLNLEGAFPEQAVYTPREVYEELKLTPLYDAQRGQWNWWMSEEQELENTNRYADDQLLGVLAEAQFNPEAARALYEQLKTTPLYDPTRAHWSWYMSQEQELIGSNIYAYSQLLGVLVEAQFNAEAARALYEQLMTTPLYDTERGQWNECMSRAQKLGSTDRTAYTHLLGVLVEAQFDPAGARALYGRLRATPLYDTQRGQWSCHMSNEQELMGIYCDADVRLLGVLVEAQFDPEEARALYDKLMATPLYDAQHGQWSMSEEQMLRHSWRPANAQLLGVLVEAKLIATLPRALSEAIPPLPITEDW